MSLVEYAPGKSRRIQLVGGPNRCSTVWAIFSGKRSADIYICPRMSGGAVKVSLHQSGSWQVGVTKEHSAHIEGTSRHWEIWKRGGELAPGVVRAWYLLIPDQEHRVADHDSKAHLLPAVGPNYAASIEILMMDSAGPTVNFDDAHIVGRWLLEGRSESCLVVTRRVPWNSEQQNWAESARKHAVAQAETAGIPKRKEHRYYFHGHDAQGVRFGLELAAT